MWMSFDHDTIHVRSTVFWGQESLSLGDIKHLRIELINERGKVVEEDWCHYHLAKMSDFPKLKIVDEESRKDRVEGTKLLHLVRTG